MAGISSKAALSSLSAYKYNAGSELEDEGGLNYYNTFYRKYDAQIGRFTGVDILAEKVFNQSTFQYGSNNPIFYNDPSGALNDWLDDAPAWLATLWNNVLDGHDVHFTPTMSFGGGYGGGENGDGGIVFSASEMSNMHSGTSHGQSGFWFTYSYTQGPLASTAWREGNNNTEGYSSTNEQNLVFQQTFVSDFNSNMQYAGAGFSDDFGQAFNAGSVFYGAAELGLQSIRQNNGPQIIGRFIGIGTKQTAQALKGTLGTISKVGKGLGLLGYGIQVVSTGSKFVNGEEISTAEGVGFGISTILVGGASLAAGTFAAPFVAGGALVYGIAELGSYIISGNTLEENIFEK